MKLKPGLHTMPSGAPFLPSLAKGLINLYEDRLKDALIFLPTRRAVRDLTRALSESYGDKRGVVFLPRMRPLADIDPDEPPFEPGYLANRVDPAISSMRRKSELSRIVRRFHNHTSDIPLDAAGALALVDPILAILDDAALEHVPLNNLSALTDIQAQAALHFQTAAELYKILQTYWPEFLMQEKLMDPMARRVALLDALSDVWIERPPKFPVIIAGSTGTLKATRRLMRCVLSQDDGLVVLPGLDKHLTNAAWENVGPEHPQHSLKNLLRNLEHPHTDVPTWPLTVTTGSTPLAAQQLEARRRVISESLVPTDDTADWPGRIAVLRQTYPDDDIFKAALEGLSLIEARTDEEEAMTIALIFRDLLQSPDRTGALVTPDAQLARRVKASLRRWDIDIDVSQGEPLEETLIGQYIMRLLDLVADTDDTLKMSNVMAHRLTACGKSPGAAKSAWQAYEKALRLPRWNRDTIIPAPDCVQVVLKAVADFHSDAEKGVKAPARVWARQITQLAEILARTPDQTGATRLWQGAAGESAATLIESLMSDADALGDMDLGDFTRVLSRFMRAQVVRARYGTHPRLQILGPLEARMLSADVIVLGGLNEGTWPGHPTIGPFLSRGMRQAMGLSLPERRYGLTAHDFAELATNPNVILTRSERGPEGPTVASRWIWRLKTLCKGALGASATQQLRTDKPYLSWARHMDHVAPEDRVIIDPPRPTPDVKDRWPNGRRQLSVTKITTWIRDPYSIYARYILRLQPLNDLKVSLGPSEYGSAIHNGIEAFSKAIGDGWPDDAPTKLLEYLKQGYLEAGYPAQNFAREAIRLEQIANQVCAWMVARREAGWRPAGIEIKSEYNLPDVNFKITARADRIETGPNGYAVIDYKTGTPATVDVVKAGFDVQLPLTALMVEKNGFGYVTAGSVEEFGYLQVKPRENATIFHSLTNPDQQKYLDIKRSVAFAEKQITDLIIKFDDPATPYLSQPRVQYTHDYGEYDLLARRPEWSRDIGGDDA